MNTNEDCIPLNLEETLFYVHGPHGAVHVAEGVTELALLFDCCWISTDDPDTAVIDAVAALLGDYGGSLSRIGYYTSDEHDTAALHEALTGNAEAARPFDFPSEEDPLFIAVVEVPTDRLIKLLERMRSYAPFVAHANVSWPGEFRTIVFDAVGPLEFWH